MVPYADFNLIPFPDKAQAMAKIKDLTMLTDILSTGFHGAINAGVVLDPRSTLLARAQSAWLLQSLLRSSTPRLFWSET